MNMQLKKLLLIAALIFLTGILKSRANVLVMNGLTHENQLSPGEKSTDRIQLQNASGQVKSVKIYQTDYWFSYKGESFYDKPGTIKRSNAAWITVSQLFVTLQPNEIKDIEFEVRVPQNDSLTGSFWSVIMVEGMAPIDTSASKQRITINTVLRYAIQVVTSIGNTGTRNLEFLNFGLGKEEGTTYFEADIENTGERMLRPEVGLELFDKNGVSQGVKKVEPKRIYPGTSVKMKVPLDGIVPGGYTGVLVADCNDDYIFGSNVNLEL